MSPSLVASDMTTSVQLAPKPQIRGFMSERQKEFRRTFPEFILDLPKHSFLDQKTFKIDGYFVGENIGSVVLRVRDRSGVYVVKSAREPRNLEIEVLFLHEWEKVGVPVLKVLEFVPATQQFPIACAILEYIPEQTTEDRLKGASKRTWISTYRKFGEYLALMHTTRGSGYGAVVDLKKLKGEFKTFTQEQYFYLSQKQKKVLFDSKFIGPSDWVLVERAIAIIEDDIKNGACPALLHDDAGVHNTFGIKKLKFFDPNPRISHPAKDLGLALIWTCLRDNRREMRDALLAGYRSNKTMKDLVVHAGVYLRLLGKWEWWLHRGKTEKVAFDWIDKTKWMFEESKSKLKSSEEKMRDSKPAAK